MRTINSKISILVILCFTSIFTISCVEESFKGPETAGEGNGFFSLNVDMGNLPSLARSGEEQGTLEELKIYDVRIVLYEGGDVQPGSCKVKYVFDLDINTPDTWNNPGSTSGWLQGDDLLEQVKTGNTLKFASNVKRVAKRDYKMLVLINGKDIKIANSQKTVYNVTTEGCFLYQLNEAVDLELNSLTGIVGNGKGFFMSNHNNLVNISAEQLKQIDKEAIDSPISVNVDRIVSKVMVKHASGFTFPDGVDPASATWGLAVTNKKTFWMRKTLTNESSVGMANLYAEDPNYANTSIKLEDHFKKLLYIDNGSVMLSPASFTNKLRDYEYVLENTISSESSSDNKKYMDQVTHVVVGYKYTPEGYSANESYYVFNNKIISVADMNGYKTGGNIPSSLSGLEIALKQIDQIKYPLDGTSQYYYETAGIQFCPKGQVYYYFPIRHFNQPEGTLGYYGVVRNNIYEITINSLKVPENNDGYTSAEISIQPWSMRGQTNTVGVSIVERKWAQVKLYHQLHYGGPNLYEIWTERLGHKYQYQTILMYINSVVSGGNQELSKEFRRDLPQYSDINYIYGIPDEFIVTENSANNVMYLIYSRTYALVALDNKSPVCFVKADGTVLKVEGINPYNNDIFTDNPYSYTIQFLEQVPDDGYLYQFVGHLSTLFQMKITDSSNVQYKVTDQQAFVRFYDTTKPLINNKLTLEGVAMSEPIQIGSKAGVIQGRRGMGILCEPK